MKILIIMVKVANNVFQTVLPAWKISKNFENSSKFDDIVFSRSGESFKILSIWWIS